MKRKIVDFMTFIYCLIVSYLSLASCDSELDVQQEYPLTVESVPVADKVADGETVEIHLEIKVEESFFEAVYTLRYLQPDGRGSLKMEDSTVLKPNNRYLLNKLRFRLHYTLRNANVSQTVGLCSEDSWGNLQRLSYDLNADDTPPAKRDDTREKEVQS